MIKNNHKLHEFLINAGYLFGLVLIMVAIFSTVASLIEQDASEKQLLLYMGAFLGIAGCMIIFILRSLKSTKNKRENKNS